jgi:hypothetical protein
MGGLMADISLSTYEHAHAEKSHHGMVPGIGFVRMGPLPMPPIPLAEAAACSPPQGTETGTLHTLIEPGGDEHPNMRWFGETREWAPLVPFAGHRLGYTATYLAAHGWKYGHSQ